MRHLIAIHLLLLSFLRLFALPARCVADMLLDFELETACRAQPRLKTAVETLQAVGGATVLLLFPGLLISPAGQWAVHTGPSVVFALLTAYIVVAFFGQLVLVVLTFAAVRIAQAVRDAWRSALNTADEKLDRTPEKETIS